MAFLDLAKERYSVRSYSDRVVEQEKLDLILEAGRVAPTARNLQPFRIYVLQSKEAMAKLEELSPCVFGARTALLFTYDIREDWKNPDEEGVHAGVEDVSIAATHCMLQAAELGVDTTWCNRFPNSRLEQAFGIPEQERSVLFMLIGYRTEDAAPSPNHEAMKPMNELVKYL